MVGGCLQQPRRRGSLLASRREQRDAAVCAGQKAAGRSLMEGVWHSTVPHSFLALQQAVSICFYAAAERCILACLAYFAAFRVCCMHNCSSPVSRFHA